MTQKCLSFLRQKENKQEIKIKVNFNELSNFLGVSWMWIQMHSVLHEHSRNVRNFTVDQRACQFEPNQTESFYYVQMKNSCALFFVRSLIVLFWFHHCCFCCYEEISVRGFVIVFCCLYLFGMLMFFCVKCSFGCFSIIAVSQCSKGRARYAFVCNLIEARL